MATVLHPDVLARFNFAPGRGYDRASVHEFRASALAVIDELLAERDAGNTARIDQLSEDERAMLAAFRLLDDERRADLLGDLFVLCAPQVAAMSNAPAHAVGTAFDMAGAEQAALGPVSNGRYPERILGWPPPAVLQSMRESVERVAAAWPPPGAMVVRPAG